MWYWYLLAILLWILFFGCIAVVIGALVVMHDQTCNKK